MLGAAVAVSCVFPLLYLCVQCNVPVLDFAATMRMTQSRHPRRLKVTPMHSPCTCSNTKRQVQAFA